MFLVDQLILLGAVLLLIGIVSSKISMRVGLPVLVLFLVVGMLAGEDGIGRIQFDNYQVAHAIGSLALAAILFDGGLQTPLQSIKMVWKPASLMATIGVFITAAVTGVAAAYILKIPIYHGLLLGSIVGSTDAAAVFSVLRSQGLHLRQRLAALLEVESGSNDPAAIFLTVGLIEIVLGRADFGPDLLKLFFLQMGVGAAVGLGVGWLAVRLINSIDLTTAGLYPVLTGACGLLAFGVAAWLGGSGFLAIYLAGIVLGNNRIVFQRGTFLFHDGLAWIGQIAMFVVLGLLSTPSELLGIAWQGLAISAVLIFVARPLAVVPLMLPFGFNWKEHLFVSWVGLKGAVPIILATYPLMFDVPNGRLLFDAVFFVVLVSAISQGWTLPFFATRLGLQDDVRPRPSVSLEITALKDVDADIVEYTVEDETRTVGRRLRRLALPDGVVVALIARGNNVIPPRGSTKIAAGDRLFVVLRPETRPVVDRIFSHDRLDAEIPAQVEFPLMGTATAGDLQEIYDIRLGVPAEKTLDEVIRDRLGGVPELDSTVETEGISLRVLRTEHDHVTWVGVTLPTPALVEDAASGAERRNSEPVTAGTEPQDAKSD